HLVELGLADVVQPGAARRERALHLHRLGRIRRRRRGRRRRRSLDRRRRRRGPRTRGGGGGGGRGGGRQEPGEEGQAHEAADGAVLVDRVELGEVRAQGEVEGPVAPAEPQA